jgi:beta-N-acetylhexosaminidase
LIVSRYAGTAPDAALLQRIRRGQVGGVILFGENTAGGLAATARGVTRLQDAARRGGSYPLLIMTDQEGGTVKRFAEIPPARSAQAAGSAADARAEGRATGQALRAIGVNVDLAPVADVEQGPGSFLGSRSFGSDPRLVAERACAFAAGLAEMGVAYTLKHFPGLGTADSSTDLSPVSVQADRQQLRASYGAYRRCGRGPRGLVMISSAGYPGLTRSDAPAVVSPEVYGSELAAARITLPTISDDLDAPAMAKLEAPARRALNAGLDLLLFAGAESASAHAYVLLAGDLRRGSLDAVRVARAAESITRLKEGLR